MKTAWECSITVVHLYISTNGFLRIPSSVFEWATIYANSVILNIHVACRRIFFVYFDLINWKDLLGIKNLNLKILKCFLCEHIIFIQWLLLSFIQWLCADRVLKCHNLFSLKTDLHECSTLFTNIIVNDFNLIFIKFQTFKIQLLILLTCLSNNVWLTID